MIVKRSAGIVQELRASLAFVERNFALVRRYLGWEIAFVVYAVVNTLTIGLIGVGVPGFSGDETMVLYLVSGALLWGFLAVLFEEVGNSIAWERWEGTIEYTFMAPIHRLTHLGGTCLFAIAYGVLRTIVVLVAVSFFFDLDLSQSNLWGALAVLLASSLSFIGLGFIAAVLPLLSPEKGPQATMIFQAALLLVSGVYYDVQALPEYLQPLAMVSPATYTLRGARAALLEGAGWESLSGDVMLLFILGAILIPFGLWVFHVGEEYAMRSGRLKRNG